MKILVACEESQAVTKELRHLGHEAYSCDIIAPSGGRPEWHIQGDVLNVLNPRKQYIPGDEWHGFKFRTMDGTLHCIEGKWDLIVAFPPCTHLAVSGATWFEAKRADGRQRDGIEFFCQFLTADCERIAIENPVGIIGGDYIPQHFPDLAEKYNFPRKPTQVIHPWMFGDPFEKKTCLWLKNLPALDSTNAVQPPPRAKFASGKTMPAWYAQAWRLPPEERAKVRSKTFPGIAKAMAEQWAGVCL